MMEECAASYSEHLITVGAIIKIRKIMCQWYLYLRVSDTHHLLVSKWKKKCILPKVVRLYMC